MRKTLAAITVLTGLACSTAHADILWDQSALNITPTSVSFVNSVSPGFNGVIAFGVSDIVVPAPGWNVQSVSTYFSSLTWFSDTTVTEAVLNVFPKSGTTPIAGDDPRATPIGSGVIVPVTMTGFEFNFNGVWEIKASGLNVNLPAGEYWVGLTPIGPGGFFGPDLQWTTTNLQGVGQQVRMFDPSSGWLDHSSLLETVPTDGAIKIQGVVPAPSSLALLGLGGLMARRRHR